MALLKLQKQDLPLPSQLTPFAIEELPQIQQVLHLAVCEVERHLHIQQGGFVD